MKQITAIVLVLLMALQCFYKLGVITYFNLNQEYIAETLCINKDRPQLACHGQCFLKKNLTIPDKTNPDNKGLPTTRQTIDFPVFLISEMSFSTTVIPADVEANFHYITGSSLDYSPSLLRPPAFFA